MRWPSSDQARRTQIQRLEAVVKTCIEEPDFLAVLGALYLENGDPAQALIWLERALLLDPGNLGAQADYALALESQGQPEALRELAQQWRQRSDIPAALRAKLYPEVPRNIYALPAVRFGQPERQTFGTQTDFGLMTGYENNLDRSPRLTELTLSIPEGSFVLPVISEPRKGRASMATAAFMAAYAPTPATVLRSGISVNARRASAQRNTDWHQMQWTNELVQRGPWWRAQLDGTLSWVGGPLNEPYRLSRWAATAEITLPVCGARAGYVEERRKQSSTASLDAHSKIWSASVYCPLPGAPTWTAALTLNEGADMPDLGERPGGRQRIALSAFRLTGLLGIDTAVDLAWRAAGVRDAEGYSALLENNAIRRVTLRQTSLEISQPLSRFGWSGTTLTMQWQSARQSSNLKLFIYRADSLYGGMRWTW